MANMLMDGDLVAVVYPDKTYFQGLVTAAKDRDVLIENFDNACVLEFTCMDGTNWKDERGQTARVEVLTVEKFVKRTKDIGIGWMFERMEYALEKGVAL